MTNFDLLEKYIDELRIKYLTAQLFPKLLLDNFCDEEKLLKAYTNVPE